ncbi:MAG: acetyl-CoA carboxylase biotin carboxyl carrier protein subunit [Hyphomicrobiales bacterium]
MAENKNEVNATGIEAELISGELVIDEVSYPTLLTKQYMDRKPYKELDLREIKTVIPGTIIELFVKPGDKVNAGDKLLILEAMKMHNTIIAPIDGEIKEVRVKVGERLAKNILMILFK